LTGLRLSWLGTPLIELDGQPIHLETRKATALLAYCCLSPQNLSREVLANLFWPEYDQKHTQANLRRSLYGINHCLYGDIFVSDGGVIGINQKRPIWLDVRAFHWQLETVHSHAHINLDACAECLACLEQAASLYRGEFLSGLNLPDCPGFDEWQRFQRESLQQELAPVLGVLASAYAAGSEWDGAIADARR
jgi:DNA-binding SARP family transcriptional activator